MKKLILSGIIKKHWDSWDKILLEQPNGYLIDLVGRLTELRYNCEYNMVQVNYHVCEKPLTEIELKEAHIMAISGGLSAEYEANEYRYSSWTSGTDYDTIIAVGNHNLFTELNGCEGEWAYFEINYK